MQSYKLLILLLIQIKITDSERYAQFWFGFLIIKLVEKLQHSRKILHNSICLSNWLITIYLYLCKPFLYLSLTIYLSKFYLCIYNLTIYHLSIHLFMYLSIFYIYIFDYLSTILPFYATQIIKTFLNSRISADCEILILQNVPLV